MTVTYDHVVAVCVLIIASIYGWLITDLFLGRKR